MTPILSAGDLAYIRASVAQLLPDTCTIQVGTETQDAQGSTTVSWANTYTGIPCRLDPVDRRQFEFIGDAHRQDSTPEFEFAIPWNQPITAKNRIVHGGFTYEVERVSDDHSWIGVCMLELRRID